MSSTLAATLLPVAFAVVAPRSTPNASPLPARAASAVALGSPYAERHLLGIGRVGDLDGDGAGDLCLRSLRDSACPELIAIASASGAVLWIAQAPEGFREHSTEPPRYGVAALGDLDGDGYDEVATVWRAAEPTGEVFEHAIGIHAGIDGVQIGLTRVPGAPHDIAIVACADHDGDAQPDLLVLAPRCDLRPGSLALVSTASGEELWRAPCAARRAAGGIAIAPVRDTDGDGCEDVAVALDDAVLVVSGRTGRTLRRIDATALGLKPAEGLPWVIAPQLVALGDVDEDGQPDVAVPMRRVCGHRSALAFVSLARGAVVARADLPIWAPELYGAGFAVVADADADLQPDVLVADPYWNRANAERNGAVDIGAVRLVSGLDGHAIRLWEGGPCTSRAGQLACPAGDVDRDGVADVWFSAFESCAKLGESLALASGKSGAILRWIDLGRLAVEPVR